MFKGNQANCAPKMVLSGSHDLLKTPEVHDTTACSNISDRSIYSCGLCHRVSRALSALGPAPHAVSCKAVAGQSSATAMDVSESCVAAIVR